MSNELLEGNTDTSGNLKVIITADSGETPGQNVRDGDGPGVTDTNGNLMCKAYA